jgi:hypothetical protein
MAPASEVNSLPVWSAPIAWGTAAQRRHSIEARVDGIRPIGIQRNAAGVKALAATDLDGVGAQFGAAKSNWRWRPSTQRHFGKRAYNRLSMLDVHTRQMYERLCSHRTFNSVGCR